jgi:uncharacterized RDD family membrane protein YckC
MRCPKCHYLSFDPEPRCRNCGYSLALEDPADLRLTPADDEADVEGFDLTLHGDSPIDLTMPAESDPHGRTPEPSRENHLDPLPLPIPPRGPFDLPRDVKGPDSPAEPPTAAPRISEVTSPPRSTPPRKSAPPVTTELPLFVRGLSDDDPRVSEASPSSDAAGLPIRPEPRAPVSVRRPAVEIAERPQGAAPARKLGPLERDLLEDLQRIERAEGSAVAAHQSAWTGQRDRAGAARRLAAAAIDALLLGMINAAVVALTLRWVGLPLEAVTLLPALPTVAFLLLLAFFYLLLFTAAGGQTVGKMIAGIRVVAVSGESSDGLPVSFGQAVYRELVTLPSVLVAGAGFVPALVGDHRALHDRLADTRVVRA